VDRRGKRGFTVGITRWRFYERALSEGLRSFPNAHTLRINTDNPTPAIRGGHPPSLRGTHGVSFPRTSFVRHNPFEVLNIGRGVSRLALGNLGKVFARVTRSRRIAASGWEWGGGVCNVTSSFMLLTLART